MTYRMLEDVEWEALNGVDVTVEVSRSLIILVTKKEGKIVKIARATRPGHRAKATRADAPVDGARGVPAEPG
jgi:hypothetical protein